MELLPNIEGIEHYSNMNWHTGLSTFYQKLMFADDEFTPYLASEGVIIISKIIQNWQISRWKLLKYHKNDPTWVIYIVWHNNFHVYINMDLQFDSLSAFYAIVYFLE